MLRHQKSSDSIARPNDPNTAHLASNDDDDIKKYGRLRRRQYSEIHRGQDIEEVWFPGGHADIGGGWGKSEKETWMLSHAPLVWMVHEAAKAGLEFDPT